MSRTHLGQRIDIWEPLRSPEFQSVAARAPRMLLLGWSCGRGWLSVRWGYVRAHASGSSNHRPRESLPSIPSFVQDQSSRTLIVELHPPVAHSVLPSLPMM